jgi:DNA-binding XRE family transcriptional regulator
MTTAVSEANRKTRARTAVRLALESGRLTKPDACERCGAVTALEGHHADYSKPLEVEWVCDPCHHAVHDPFESRHKRTEKPSEPLIVGRNIKAAREAAGLTQEQLAERAGMLTHEISRYERGVRDLRLTTAVRIARGLDIPPSELLRNL